MIKLVGSLASTGTSYMALPYTSNGMESWQQFNVTKYIASLHHVQKLVSSGTADVNFKHVLISTEIYSSSSAHCL